MKIVNTEEFNQIISNGITLVDFYADWCGPCKMLGPIIEDLDNEFPEIEFIKVNVDDNMDLTDKYGIMSIPAVFIFKDNQIVSSMLGYRDKNGVKEFIDSSLNK